MPVIKRYTNRKLYDTDARRYVTLDDIGVAIRRGEDISVIDHASGADITSLTMLQILFEEEKKLSGLLPLMLLTRMIRAGKDRLNTLLTHADPAYGDTPNVNEEIRQRIEVLVQKGDLSPEEGEHLVTTLLEAEEPALPVEPADEPATHADVQGLLEEISRLSHQIDDLAKK